MDSEILFKIKENNSETDKNKNLITSIPLPNMSINVVFMKNVSWHGTSDLF